ncbi:MAG TPA: glycoside hydrolase family 3 C-terminal domain-containing protein [Candidatus Dormibacteraeota bacterium]|nr:glycoside hydrolase family 3 C-terminal domain-containing protein [Candidatus Dormibacteraeota bacterium]
MSIATFGANESMSKINSYRFGVAAVLLSLVQFVAAQTTPAAADVETRVDSILSKMTLQEKIEIIGGTKDFYTRPIPRLGIPSLRMSDGPMGVHDYGLTTAYPAGIALAASWDVDLAEHFGTAMGKDARARGVHFILGPGMNIYRAPMNGRNFEYFGEDPFLASKMAVSVINGIQGQRVIATAKHFAGNNSEFARMTLSSGIDERTLREIYLPAFEASVKDAHVGAVMDAYNLVNGTYMTQNSYLNNEILKKDWGFDGIVMSDWGATHDGLAAANGGLDLEMPAPTFMNRDALLPAIDAGKMPVAILDDKVRRILRKAIEFGFLDQPQTDTSIPSYNQEGRQVALEIARGSMVLLKNTGNLLPLDESKVKTIAVLGPDAYPAVVGGGGSSETRPFNAVSYLEGISNRMGTKAKVLYAVDVPVLDEVFENSEFVTAPGGESGLNGEYFSNEELKGPPALARTDKHVHFDWGEGSFAPGEPVDHFSIRWTGYFVPKESGDYKFFTSADDGVRLYVGDEIAIDDWQPHSQTLDTAARHLEAGRAYKIRLEYFESVGSAIVGFGVTRAEAFIGRETKALAAKADAVVVCVGFDDKTEGEGFDRPFQLPGGQDELIRQIGTVNKNVIVVLTTGGNVDMTRWVENVPAILQAWYPGQEGGTGLAQILFGDFSPSGKLPASFERRWEDDPAFHSYYPKPGESRVDYSEGVFVGYRHFDRSEAKPLFAFGYGLSYTTFAYSKLSVTPQTGNLNEPVSVSFYVKNTGHREGAEVAELYVGDSHSSVPRPIKELKAFAKVNLKPGESRHITLTLNRRAFSFYDVQKKGWSAEPGDFSILVGGSSANIRLQGKFTLTH